MTISQNVVHQWTAAQVVPPAHTERRPPLFANVSLYWTRVDACAVKASIRINGAATVWAWSRELMAQGLERQVGAGDVRFRPIGEVVDLTLIGPPPGRPHARDVECHLLLSKTWLEGFLAHTYDGCPLGQEFTGYDCEAELRDMLAGGGLSEAA